MDDSDLVGDADTTEVISLGKFNELRIDVASSAFVRIRLVSGTAEIFGTELGRNVWFEFTNCSLSVFTWHGCELQLAGPCHHYTHPYDPMDETNPWLKYLSLHSELDDQRNTGKGPRVMIVGSRDSGKTSLAKILFSYATRTLHKVSYVDLNCSTVGIVPLPPSTISAVVMNRVPFSLSSGFSSCSPLAYFFGGSSRSQNPELFLRLVTNMAQALNQKMASDHVLQKGGLFVDLEAPEETRAEGEFSYFSTLSRIGEAFGIDRVVVIGSGRLLHDVQECFKDAPVLVGSVTANDGVVSKAEKQRAQQDLLTKEYFYGPQKTLSPHNATLRFADMVIVRIGGGLIAPESSLPLRTKSVIDKCRITVVAPSLELKNSILAVSTAEEEAQVLEANVCGFLHVTTVDMTRKELKVLAPSSSVLTRRYFIWGDVKWIDE